LDRRCSHTHHLNPTTQLVLLYLARFLICLPAGDVAILLVFLELLIWYFILLLPYRLASFIFIYVSRTFSLSIVSAPY
jgi:energy-coupling factor transporter transmembrane protein EcfT